MLAAGGETVCKAFPVCRFNARTRRRAIRLANSETQSVGVDPLFPSVPQGIAVVLRHDTPSAPAVRFIQPRVVGYPYISYEGSFSFSTKPTCPYICAQFLRFFFFFLFCFLLHKRGPPSNSFYSASKSGRLDCRCHFLTVIASKYIPFPECPFPRQSLGFQHLW